MKQFIADVGERAALRNVYAHLQDEESRTIYRARSLFSLTDDREELRSVVRNMAVGKELLAAFRAHEGHPMALFGAGQWGKAILRYFPEIPWAFVVDNYKAGGEIGGFPILSVEDLKQRGTEDLLIVNALMFAYDDVETQLLQAGFQKEQILSLGRFAEERQYFDLPELSHDAHEVFVDVGAYNGATSRAFAKWAGDYDHIYAFEPFPEFQEAYRKTMDGMPQVSLLPYGVWSRQEERAFRMDGEGSSCIEGTDVHGGVQRCAS